MSKVSKKLNDEINSQSDWKTLKAIFIDEFPRELPRNKQKMLLLLMLQKIHELSDDCMFLAKHNKYRSVYMIQRSIFEAYVELVLLLKDENYVEVMEKNHLNRMAHFYEHTDKALFDKYKAEGLRAVSFAKKFKEVGLEKNYNSFYRIASGEIHPTLASLKSNCKWNEDGSISLGVIPEEAKHYLYFHCLGLFADAIHDVFSFLSCSSETLNKIEVIGNSLQEKANSIWERNK